ncbi:DegV family protein [Halalkalibacterium ligniniphilum]|uniref:DegV family protein n=1 Tax=Halalkalibacterium ligniniphilum TaxID=1134413 RepID=UPI00034D7169|nr:DegV family protein [Halalkalibacterium ligniniphilum]
MKNVAIVTDSTAYLDPEVRKELGIHMVPLSVVFGEEAFQEEIDLTTEAFYEKMKQTDKLPTTSQPAIGHFVEMFESLAKEGFQAVISIHLSSKISGTYQSAISAADMVEGIEVFGFDSEISCAPQGYFVIEAARMAQKGAEAQEILDQLVAMKDRLRAYFMVDDLNHLHRGGRLNAAQLVVGSILKIKPVLHFEEGSIVPFEKVRTEKKALARIKGLFAEDASSGEAIQATVIHANRLDAAEELAEELRTQYPNASVGISHFGPVIGTHLGAGSLGLSWMKTKN